MITFFFIIIFRKQNHPHTTSSKVRSTRLEAKHITTQGHEMTTSFKLQIQRKKEYISEPAAMSLSQLLLLQVIFRGGPDAAALGDQQASSMKTGLVVTLEDICFTGEPKLLSRVAVLRPL